MPLDSARRRQLLSKSHALKAHIHIGREGITEGALDLVRQALASAEMVKVRIGAETGDHADAIARDLARRVPCELVKRIGFVALLCRADGDAPRADTSLNDHDSDAGEEFD